MTISSDNLVPVVVAATIALWATRRLPEYLTGLLFFAAATILALAPAGVIFSGFASSALWLVLSGFVIGAAIQKTGLANRIARRMVPSLRGSYPRLVIGVVALTYALAFVMPSNMGRIALLMPIVMALADQAGLGIGDRGRFGLALAVGFGTFMLSTSILPANVPNQVMAGAIETAYGLHLGYFPYLVLHAPVLGLVKGALMAACLCLLFSSRPAWSASTEQPGPMSKAERRLGVLLLVTLALWFTDTWHGIAPAWVGLATACLCLLPRVGFLTSEEFATSANVRTLIYVAAILGLAALVAKSGLGERIGTALIAHLPFDLQAPFRNFLAMTGLAVALNFVVTANGVPALYTPLANALASASGFPLPTVLMIQVLGFSTVVLPYQAAPIVVAMEMGRVPVGPAIRFSLLLTAVTFVVVVPLDYLWFAALGML